VASRAAPAGPGSLPPATRCEKGGWVGDPPGSAFLLRKCHDSNDDDDDDDGHDDGGDLWDPRIFEKPSKLSKQ